MKVESILSKPKSKKKYMFYCYECDNKKMLYMGRHWCSCANPGFQMGLETPAELKKSGDELTKLFKMLSRSR